MLPSTEVHYDDEIYEEPRVFKWDRFLNKAKFMKNGKAVTKNEMAFGGGGSWCPGRHFARNEMKAIVAVLLHCFDFELDGALPEVDKQRYSLGIYTPSKEVKIKLKSRQ
jgi:cytochrome P450